MNAGVVIPQAGDSVVRRTGVQVDSWCERPAGLAEKLSEAEWRAEVADGGLEDEACSLVPANWTAWAAAHNSSGVRPPDCHRRQFDTAQFSSTITSEFGLVCGREYLTSLAQTLYFVGMIFGVFTFGILADLYGRKKV